MAGATSGIGLACAVEAAARGAKVVLAGRRQAQGDAAVAEIAQNGGEAVFIKTDVAVEADCIAMVDKAVTHFGKLDAAINNAGVSKPTTVVSAKERDYDLMFNVNVKGVFFCMKHEVTAMLKSGGGSIVNM